tara:strand:- start:1182 stop:1880 length:699 start_codon:yes stop_codon:yes gene_type:complete
MKTIEQVLQELFTENTGKHFLDSGGTDGRAWQRNQERDFESEPEATIEYWDDKFEYVTINTYHYFKKVLEYDEVCESVNEYLRENNIHWVVKVDENDLEDHITTFVEFKSEQWNTYNGENNTDHVFQGRWVTIDGEPYVLLQLHLGADVRGGYSDVQLFKVEGFLTGFVEHSLYNNKRENLSIDIRHPNEISLYNHEDGSDEYVDNDWLEENVKPNQGWEVELMIMEDPCIY